MIDTPMINTTKTTTTKINMVGEQPTAVRRTFGRRTLLAGGLAVSALLVGAGPARATGVRAGDLQFTVPASIRPVRPSAPWQWYGTQPGETDPLIAVMARGDLHGDSPQELQTALFAPQLTGRVPNLVLGSPQLSSDADTVQLRQPFGYEPRTGEQQTGSALMITAQGRAGLLVVVGDPKVITAGMLDGIMGSARFSS